MKTTFRAHYDGSVLVPEEPVDLPLGKVLKVDVTDAGLMKPAAEDNDGLPLLKLLRSLETLPENLEAPQDAAANLEHYLYGAEKQE